MLDGTSVEGEMDLSESFLEAVMQFDSLQNQLISSQYAKRPVETDPHYSTSMRRYLMLADAVACYKSSVNAKPSK